MFLDAGGIEGREVFSNGTGCLLHPRPGNRLVAGKTLILVHIRLDQARIDRKCLAAAKPGYDAHRHHALEHSPQSIALAKALVPRAAEHRMIGNLSSMPSLQNHL